LECDLLASSVNNVKYHVNAFARNTAGDMKEHVTQKQKSRKDNVNKNQN